MFSRSRSVAVRGRVRARRSTTAAPSKASTAEPLEQSDVFSSVVPNTGSTARDHLANERTFLAWARTGLTFVGLGVAIDSLLRVSASLDEPQKSEGGGEKNDHGRWGDKWKVHAPATGLVLTGGSVLTYSTFRYFRVQRCLQQGTFPLNRVGMGAVVVSTSLLTLASLMMTISDEELDTRDWHPLSLTLPHKSELSKRRKPESTGSAKHIE